jgi:hypothetical protein
MSDRTKVKIAFAEAIMQTLWVKGLITAKERDQIVKKTGEKLQQSNC